MFGFGKRQSKQNVCLLSETNSVKDDRLIAGTLHAESPDTAEAWALDSGQQCKDKKSGRYIQFISAVSCQPVKIYKNSGHVEPKEVDPSLISSQTEDQEMTFIDYKPSKDLRLILIAIAFMAFTLTLSIIALVALRS